MVSRQQSTVGSFPELFFSFSALYVVVGWSVNVKQLFSLTLAWTAYFINYTMMIIMTPPIPIIIITKIKRKLI